MSGHREGSIPSMVDRTWTLAQLREAFEEYASQGNDAKLAPATKTTYLQHADRFVRWLAGEVRLPK